MNERERWIRPGAAGAAGVVLAAALLAGCSSGASDSAPSPVVAVQVATVRQGPLQQWIRTQAVLYPLHQAVITPKISAPVARLEVERGDRVRAGELVAELENRDLQAAAQAAEGQLQAAQAAYATAVAGAIPAQLKAAQLNLAATRQALDNAQRVYASRQRLFQQGAIPRLALEQAGVALTDARNAHTLAQQQLQALEAGGGHAQALKAAQGNLTTAQAQAAAAQAMLAYSRLTSPIAGVVTDRPVYTGELATPAAPLMTIMNLSQVVARASLPASQAALLQVGDPATLTPAGGAPLPARVSVVSPTTDPGSTTVEVWVQAANPHQSLRPGTSVAVAMLARTLPQAVTVPSAAVLIDYSGGASVMVVGGDGKAHQTAVTLGVQEPDRDQILEGVAVGQRVVTVGAYGLPDGAQIKIEAPAPPAAQDAQP
ncbi:MAG TPA: efflux RND transporter periplasmic adaptor subunit [Terriglobales bacterium]|nr:efflux RND transporter periplasmic adaptor subunit [Terriglobales bacterium]